MRKDEAMLVAPPRSGDSAASALSASSAPPLRGGKRKRATTPRDKNGLGYNFFWGVLLFSLYWNVHFVLLRFQRPHHDTHHNHMERRNAKAKQEFFNTRTSSLAQLQQAIDQDAPLPPPVPLNLTTELETVVSLESAEMLLKTAWQGLVQNRGKQQSPFRIITNVVPRKRVKRKDYDLDDFTLSTHATVGRLDALLEQYITWGGPASAAVQLSSLAEIDVFLAFIHFKRRILKDIAIHVLLHDLSSSSSSSSSSGQPDYPSSILRNLAISQLETDYFVALDVDFVTNKNAYQQLRDLYTAYPNLTEVIKNKTLLVFPAFASTVSNNNNKNDAAALQNKKAKRRNQAVPAPVAPRDKQELRQKYDQGLVEPMHLQQFPFKHGATQFNVWLQQEASSTEPFYPVSYEPQFEPVVLAYRHGLPRYWTGYRGHFYNKSSWTAETHNLGYKFAVLRNFFVVYDKTPKTGKVQELKYHEWDKFVEYRERVRRGNQTTETFRNEKG